EWCSLPCARVGFVNDDFRAALFRRRLAAQSAVRSRASSVAAPLFLGGLALGSGRSMETATGGLGGGRAGVDGRLGFYRMVETRPLGPSPWRLGHARRGGWISAGTMSPILSRLEFRAVSTRRFGSNRSGD